MCHCPLTSTLVEAVRISRRSRPIERDHVEGGRLGHKFLLLETQIFRQNTPGWSRIVAVTWPRIVSVIFCHLDTLTAKPTITLGQFLPCLVGGVAGFHSVAFRRPATDGQLSLVATSFLAFGTFYWLASYSLPDLLLATLISGFGLGVVVARAFQRGFLENPVVPHVR